MSTIAETILNQLGGNKFTLMTGARQFVGGDDHLMFSLPRGFASNKINKVVITLNASDTYDIGFFQYISSGKRAGECNVIRQEMRIYGDMLCKIFTEVTGLDTRI